MLAKVVEARFSSTVEWIDEGMLAESFLPLLWVLAPLYRLSYFPLLMLFDLPLEASLDS